jgi:hypothetical protein
MFQTLLSRGEHLAQVQAQRTLLRFLNGVDWFIRDPKQVVGRTPYDVSAASWRCGAITTSTPTCRRITTCPCC